MAQEVVFIWMLVTEQQAAPPSGEYGYLVRENYRAVPLGMPIAVIRRSDRVEIGQAEVLAVHTAETEVLLKLDLPAYAHSELTQLSTRYGTVITFRSV